MGVWHLTLRRSLLSFRSFDLMIRPDAGCAVQIVPWFSFSVPGALHLGLLTASTALAVACLLIAVANDPGACVSPAPPL